MSADETAAGPATPSRPEAAAGAQKPVARKPAPPKRDLPDPEDLGPWIEGKREVPLLAALFEGLIMAKFDGHMALIRKEELLPQHWSIIVATDPPPDEDFDQLPEVARLRAFWDDPELGRRRLSALRLAWRELRGSRPALWQVPDLFAALRRILSAKLEVDYYDLLCAVRDLWRTMDVPQGQEQLEILWNCLALIRSKTK